MKKFVSILLVLLLSAGIVGIILSIAMLVRAVQWMEWGRVVLYSVTALVGLEMILLVILKLRKKA